MAHKAFVLALIILNFTICFVDATINQDWKKATASLGPGASASGTCDYQNLNNVGYGFNPVSLGPALFNKSLTCGACFELKCVGEPGWCKPGSINVTATSSLPPNSSLPNDEHFELPETSFLQIGKFEAGSVPVEYRRVTCQGEGGINFFFGGHSNFILVSITNVGGAGTAESILVKGSRTDWLAMSWDWGQNWKTNNVDLYGQELSFKITTTDGMTKVCDNVVPSNWEFGDTYDGNCQF